MLAAPEAEPGELPGVVAWVLKGIALALAVAVVVIPAIPATRCFAVDPILGTPFLIRRGAQHDVPFDLAWAFAGLRAVPLAVRIAVAALVAGLCAVPARWRHLGAADDQAPRSLNVVVAAVGAGAVAAWIFHTWHIPFVRSRLFGDALNVPSWAEKDFATATEPVTLQMLSLVFHLRRKLFGVGDGLTAVYSVTCLAGGAFVASLVWLASTVGRNVWERATLFFGLALAGYLVMFFGYPETTFLELSATGACFAACATVLASEDSRSLTSAKVWAFAMCGLAINAHGGGILLIPCLVFLVVDVFGASPRSFWRKWRHVVSGQALTLFALLVFLPVLLVNFAPFVPRGNLGNVTGGGDDVMFVPLTIDYMHRVGGYYPFWSWWHFLDLANALVIAAPVAIPVVAVLSALTDRHRRALRAPEENLLGLFVAAAATCFLIPLVWNHDFGMWGDWNIAACYLFPLNALAWLWLVITLRRYRLSVGHYAGVALPLLIVQAACAVGLMGQMY